MKQLLKKNVNEWKMCRINKSATYPRQTVLSWLERQNEEGPKIRRQQKKHVNVKKRNTKLCKQV